jgi:hypothetical protein
MYKSMALLKCKPELTREQFIDYYETRHAPLICALLPEVCGYRRNFIHSEGAFLNPGAATRDYDVITELWFADRAAYEAAMERCANPETARRIAEVEEQFLDRSCTRMFVVDEHISTLSR